MGEADSQHCPRGGGRRSTPLAEFGLCFVLHPVYLCWRSRKRVCGSHLLQQFTTYTLQVNVLPKLYLKIGVEEKASKPQKSSFLSLSLYSKTIIYLALDSDIKLRIGNNEIITFFSKLLPPTSVLKKKNTHQVSLLQPKWNGKEIIN